MMKRLLNIFAIILCLPFSMQARTFNWGVEWGADVQAFSYRHVNYISSEGYRINESDRGFDPFLNLEILVHAGVQLSDRCNIGIYSGYAGLYSGARMIPVYMRVSFHPGNVLADGIYYYGDAGGSFIAPTLLGRLGAGYRIMIGKSSALDFLVGVRCNLEHPTVMDRDTMSPVPEEKIRRSEAAHVGLSFTISLSF